MHFVEDEQNKFKCAINRLAVIGFIEGFWGSLLKFRPAKPVGTGKALFAQ